MPYSCTLSRTKLEKQYNGIIENAGEYFPKMYERAKKLIKENSVKEYIFNERENRIFLVVGRDAQYIVTEYLVNGKLHFFCSCPDFFFNSLLKSEEEKWRPFCYHILARILLEKSKWEGQVSECTLHEKAEYWINLFSHLSE